MTAYKDNELVGGSRRAIIETGLSEQYFDAHFRVIKVVDQPSDRRVEWRFSVNGYETSLTDAIGNYTTPAGQRLDIHGIKNLLSSMHDIEKTISRGEAEKILRTCVGQFTDASVVLQAMATPGPARLYLTAHGRKRPLGPEREGREKKESGGETEGAVFEVGLVDLENGRCTRIKGKLTP